MRRSLLAVALIGAASCSGMVVDRSPDAIASGDYTLPVSACKAAPGGGMDVCHVRAGTKIEQSWIMVIPARSGHILGGEIQVYYRGLHRSYPANGPVIEVPWREFFGKEIWESSMDGEALALLEMRWKNPEGLEEVVRYRGIAKLVVTKEGYDRLPVDSGFHAVEVNCRIQYSTAGRTAVECK